MKKRILALALAGTTAFSVFGGLNVFAAVDNYKDGYETAATFSKTKIDGTVYSDLSVLRSDLEKLDFEKFDTADEIDNAKIYLYNFNVKTADNIAALEVVVNDILGLSAVNTVDGETWDDNMTNITARLAAALDAVLGTTSASTVPTVENKVVFDGSVSSYRTGVYSDFLTFQKDIKDNYDADIYEDSTAYSFDDLIADILAADATKPTTYYVHLQKEYDRLVAELDLADTTDAEDKYYAALDAANELVESDYTAANWNRVQACILEAEEKAAEADTVAEWKAAKEILDKISSIQTIKPDYADLKDAMLDLYVSGKVSAFDTGVYAADGNNKTYKDVENDNVDDTHVYIPEDYAVKNGYTDEWYEFAGYGDPSDGDGYIKGAYRAAYEVYKRCASSSQIKYVGQSVVDEALADLEAAIDALDATSSTDNWMVVRLEETIATAEDVVESDYTVTKSAWKNFVAALEEAQEVISMSNPSSRQLDNAYTTLNTALKNLKDAKKSVPAATKTDLKNLIKDAEELLKKTDGKTGAQIVTLKDKIDAGKDCWTTAYTVWDSTLTISKTEAAIADLEAAIAGYNHPQGWYQDAKGTWFYGEGTTNKTGWLELNGRTYFLKDDGSMAANTWVKTEAGYWYYLNASGAMLHDGWAKINDTWYFFKNFGGMAEGWVKDGNTWYYLQPGSGKMVTGWNLINGKYYYFNASGAMLANTTTPDGYKVDASGAWVK